MSCNAAAGDEPRGGGGAWRPWARMIDRRARRPPGQGRRRRRRLPSREREGVLPVESDGGFVEAAGTGEA